jgi:aspartate-semialdehyde dehydrogenase
MQALSAHSGRVQARPSAAAAKRPSRQRVAVVQAKKTADGPTVAIVGVTGAVGQEFLQVRGDALCH